MTTTRRDLLGAGASAALSLLPLGNTTGVAGAQIDEGESLMALYELRTYTLYVGKMVEVTKLYQEFGFPALKKGGHDKKLVGYFQGDTGTINQIVHLWKFDDDGDRRKHWAGVFANKDFVEGFASKFRPLVMTQESSC